MLEGFFWGIIFLNIKWLTGGRYGLVSRMVEGHKRASHEHRVDLAGEYRWGDVGQGVLFLVFIVGMVLDVFVVKVSESWQNVFPWYFRVVVFLVVFFVGVNFMQRAHTIVFDQEREGLMVIKTGVFGMIRHPMYFGAMLMFLGFVVLSFSVFALVIFVGIVFFYYYLCRYEERLLLEKLGEDYRRYMVSVPMWFPRGRR